MKVTIELSEAEVKGIKAYLKETSGEIAPIILREEIIEYVRGIIDATIHAPGEAVSDYISQFENNAGA